MRREKTNKETFVRPWCGWLVMKWRKQENENELLIMLIMIIMIKEKQKAR
jgi:hypothetical protein